MSLSDFSLDRYRKHASAAGWLLAVILVAAWRSEVNLGDLAKASSKAASLIGLFFPPDWESFPKMIEPALVTILIAVVATPIGTLCAVALGLASARNVSPPWLRLTTRSLIALERGIPEIVLVLILVAAFGIGPFTGVVAHDREHRHAWQA